MNRRRAFCTTDEAPVAVLLLALFSSLLAAGVSTAGEAAPSSDGDRCSDRCTNRSKRPDEVDDSSGGGDSETVFLPLTSSSRVLEPARGGSGGGGGGGGFGRTARPARTPAQQLHELRITTVREEGVCLVPGVLGRASAEQLVATV